MGLQKCGESPQQPSVESQTLWNAENQKKLYRYTDRYTGCSGTQPHGAKV